MWESDKGIFATGDEKEGDRTSAATSFASNKPSYPSQIKKTCDDHLLSRETITYNTVLRTWGL